MKFKQLLIVLSAAVGTLSFVGCEKDKKTVITPDTPEMRLTKAQYYYGNTSDTSKAALAQDSIYYNDQEQISKVNIVTDYDIISYTFEYNAAGDPSKVISNHTNGIYMYDFHFYYSADRKFDSLVQMDRNTHNIYKSVFSYTSGKLSRIRTMAYLGNGDSSLFSTVTYYRTGVKLDSIVKERPTYKAVTQFTSASVNAESGHDIGRGYLLVMSARLDITLFNSERNNLYLHQFFNPDEAVFNGGKVVVYNIASPEAAPTSSSFNNIFGFNPDNTLRSFSYVEGATGNLQPLHTLKFDYQKK